MANPGFPSLDPEISGVTEHFLLKEVKALSPCFPFAPHRPTITPQEAQNVRGWGWGGVGAGGRGELGVRGRGRLRVELPAQRSCPDSTFCVLGSIKGHL